MENLNRKGKNSRRHTGSGLGAIRPDSMNLGPTENTVERVNETANPTEAPKRTYSALDQLLRVSRMVVTEPSSNLLNKAKNSWTNH